MPGFKFDNLNVGNFQKFNQENWKKIQKIA